MYKSDPCDVLIDHNDLCGKRGRLQFTHVSISLSLMIIATVLLLLLFFAPGLDGIKDILLASVFLAIFALGSNELRSSD